SIGLAICLFSDWSSACGCFGCEHALRGSFLAGFYGLPGSGYHPRGVRRKLYLETFGCQMNVLDSELVLGQLRAQGYETIDDRDLADVILYNTCSVREH